MDLVIYANAVADYKYTTDHIMFGLPCEIVNCGSVPLVQVKDLLELHKYASFYIYPRELLHSIVPDEVAKGDISKIICITTEYKLKKKIDLYDIEISNLEEILTIRGQCHREAISDLEKYFTLIFKQLVVCRFDENNQIYFENFKEDDSSEVKIKITNNNFETLRRVIVKQNLLNEQIWIPDKDGNYDGESAKIFYRAMAAHNKNPLSTGEMIAYVKNYGGRSYEEIMNGSIFKLYSDFSCLTNRENYRTNMNFRLVCDGSKLPEVSLTQDFIKSFYEDAKSKYSVNLSSLGLGN